GGWRCVPATRDRYHRAGMEIAAIAGARGVALMDDYEQQLFEVIDSYPANHRTSAVRDILAGRPSEIDAMTGAAIRLGRAAGVPTPVNEFIYAALLPQELKARGQIAWPE
ncbi:MAG: 2-dehydropantoate 2-reductase, partial [Chloroflexi bacterium]|nr:2-dehydropantoate 2-reductase [Chloroflexota bacterium]